MASPEQPRGRGGGQCRHVLIVEDRARRTCARSCLSVALSLAAVLVGCGGEPTGREVKNAQAFEALLTAVSLKNPKEVEGDAKLIEERHTAGEISEGKYKELAAIISQSAGEGLERRRAAGIRVPRAIRRSGVVL